MPGNARCLVCGQSTGAAACITPPGNIDRITTARIQRVKQARGGRH